MDKYIVGTYSGKVTCSGCQSSRESGTCICGSISDSWEYRFLIRHKIKLKIYSGGYHFCGSIVVLWCWSCSVIICEGSSIYISVILFCSNVVHYRIICGLCNLCSRCTTRNYSMPSYYCHITVCDRIVNPSLDRSS